MRHDKGSVVEKLIPELNSPIAQSRSQALHTFSKIGEKKYYPLITDKHLFDEEDSVASTAWRTASVLVPDNEKVALVDKLITQLGRGDSDLQFGLTRFLCTLGEVIVAPLMEAAKSTKEEVRVQAEFTLLRFREMELEFKKAR
jgi:hypothetical protein